MILVTATGNPKAVMQYKHYERDIVIRYGIEMEGWTHTMFACPASLPMEIEPLQKLLEALDNGTCRFRSLTYAEREERKRTYEAKVANGAVRPRKTRSDKGKSHATRKNAVADNVEDSEGEAVPRKRARVSAAARD